MPLNFKRPFFKLDLGIVGDDIEIMEYNLEIIKDDLEIEPLRKFILDIQVLTLHIKKHRKSRNFNK